jgi:multidrug efflux pump subunit AcrB
VPGVEELKMDVDLKNPELTLNVDRERALIEGISSGQIGMAIRTALFGREVSKIKEGEDEYKIQLRNEEMQRKNLSNLLNLNIRFQDMANRGAIKSVPLSSVVKVDYTGRCQHFANRRRSAAGRDRRLFGPGPGDCPGIDSSHSRVAVQQHQQTGDHPDRDFV